jgi:hypothetical protein
MHQANYGSNSTPKTIAWFGWNSACLNTLKAIRSDFEKYRLTNVNFEVENVATASISSQNSSLFLAIFDLIKLYAQYRYFILFYVFIYGRFIITSVFRTIYRLIVGRLMNDK